MPGQPGSPRPSVVEVLRSIVHILDAAALKGGWHQPAQLVRVGPFPQAAGDAIDLGVRPLLPGMHPLTVLDGFVAPAEWHGLGVVAEGRRWPTGRARPRLPAGRVRIIDVVARDGTRVCAVRPRNHGLTLYEPPESADIDGEVSLALCRALGVPVYGGRAWRSTNGVKT